MSGRRIASLLIEALTVMANQISESTQDKALVTYAPMEATPASRLGELDPFLELLNLVKMALHKFTVPDHSHNPAKELLSLITTLTTCLLSIATYLSGVIEAQANQDNITASSATIYPPPLTKADKSPGQGSGITGTTRITQIGPQFRGKVNESIVNARQAASSGTSHTGRETQKPGEERLEGQSQGKGKKDIPSIMQNGAQFHSPVTGGAVDVSQIVKGMDGHSIMQNGAKFGSSVSGVKVEATQCCTRI